VRNERKHVEEGSGKKAQHREEGQIAEKNDHNNNRKRYVGLRPKNIYNKYV
jgi:hypothetical protein